MVAGEMSIAEQAAETYHLDGGLLEGRIGRRVAQIGRRAGVDREAVDVLSPSSGKGETGDRAPV